MVTDSDVREKDKVEQLLMLKKCRVREYEANSAHTVQPGDVVKVNGLDKLELLSRSLATRDLKAKIPAKK